MKATGDERMVREWFEVLCDVLLSCWACIVIRLRDTEVIECFHAESADVEFPGAEELNV